MFVVLIFFIPFSQLLEKFTKNKQKIVKNFLLILLITIVIFFFRNLYRIYKEIIKYDYQPIKHSSYQVRDNFFGIVNTVDKLIITLNNCNNQKLYSVKCPKFVKVNNVIIGKFLGKYYFKSMND